VEQTPSSRAEAGPAASDSGRRAEGDAPPAEGELQNGPPRSGRPNGAPKHSRRRTAALLLVILAGAAALRLAGITWGLPGPKHLFSYHPDEYFSLQAAFALLDQDPNPHRFNYPSLYLYLAAAAALAGGVPGSALASATDFQELIREFTLRARLMTVLLSLITIVAVYASASRLAGPSAGLWAAAFMAVVPGHVLYSHFAAVDVALACFTTLSLLAAISLFDDERPKMAVFAGLAAGAAAATKYNGALAAAMPLLSLGAGAFGGHKRRAAASVASRALLVIAFAVAGFFVFSPYVVLDWSHARQDIAFERDHMRQGEYPAKVADPNGWFFQVRALGYATGGSVVFAVCLALCALGVHQSWPKSAPLLVFGLVWFAVIGATGVRYARYGLPLLPLLAVGVGIGVGRVLRVERRLVGGLGALAVAVLMLGALKTSGVLAASMAFEPEPRDAALEGIRQSVRAGERVGLVRTVWFDMPPLDFNNGGDALGGMSPWNQFRDSQHDLVVISGFDVEALLRERPEWFVETDFQVGDWLRAQDAGALAFQQALESYYFCANTYQRASGWQLLGRCGPQPHDWSYPFTAVRVWALRQAEESPGDQGT